MFKFRKLKDDNGTILIFVIIIITFLLVLGSSLLTISMMGFKNNFTSKKINQAYYINDVLAEEVLSKIDEITHYADVAASEYVFSDKTHENDEWKNMLLLLDHKVAESIIIQEEADEYVRKAVKQIYEQNFFEFIVEGFSSADINFVDDTDLDITEWALIPEPVLAMGGIGLKTEYSDLLKDIKTTSNLDGIKINSITINDESFSTEDKLVINLETNAQYGSLTKKIELEVKMFMPEYTFAVSNMREMDLYENDAAKKAISTEKNIVFVDGDTTINGDIYSYGTFPSKRRVKSHEKGGVVVGYQEMADDFWDISNHYNNYLDSDDLTSSANVTVNGNIATRSGIHLMSDSSSLSVSESTYSDIVVLESNAPNSKLNVDKNVYLYEDLYINGDDGKVRVGVSDSEDGEIWGLFNDDPAGVYLDHSGSIIINAEGGNERITANKYMINGIAYQNMYIGLNPQTGEYYQTGESIIPNTEYSRFYQEQLEYRSGETKRVAYKNEDTDLEAYLYVVDEEVSTLGDLEYKIEHFFRKAKLYDGTDGGISDEDKNKITFSTIVGDSVTDDDLTKNYSRGVVVSSGKVINPNYTMDSNVFSGLLDGVVGKIDLQACFLGNRDYSVNSNLITRLDEIMDFSASELLEISDLNNLVINNSNSSKDIFINLPSSSGSKDDLIANNIVIENTDYIEGVIVTDGDIYIYSSGDFNFQGTIIGKGDIVFYGNGHKTITNNDSVVQRLLASQYNLRKLLRSDTGADVRILDGKEMNGNLDMSVSYDPDHNTLYSEEVLVESQEVTGSTIAEVKAYEILSWKEVY